MKKFFYLLGAMLLGLSILLGVSQTVCHAGEVDISIATSPTEPESTEDPDDAPNKLPTSGEEVL